MLEPGVMRLGGGSQVEPPFCMGAWGSNQVSAEPETPGGRKQRHHLVYQLCSLWPDPIAPVHGALFWDVEGGGGIYQFAEFRNLGNLGIWRI